MTEIHHVLGLIFSPPGGSPMDWSSGSGGQGTPVDDSMDHSKVSSKLLC